MANAGMNDGGRDATMHGPVVTAGTGTAGVSRPDGSSSTQADGPSLIQPGSAPPTPAVPAPEAPISTAPVSNAPTFSALAAGPQPPALEPRLAAVGTIADPHLRQQVEANVRLGTARQIAAFTDGQRQVKAQAKTIIDQGGDLSGIPARLMLQIDMPGRQALRDYAMAHGNPATDPATYYGLKNQALDDPAGFQAVDLGNHMARLKPADYTELQQLQTSLKNGQPPADLPLQQAYKANMDLLLQQLGLPTTTTASPDPAANDNIVGSRQAALLRQAIDQHVAATEVATGRRLTPADHQSLLSQVVEQRISPRPSIELKPDSALAATIMNTAVLDAAPAGQLSLDEIAAAAKVVLGRVAVAGSGLVSEVAVPALITAGGVTAGFLAGMWPKSTATNDVLYGAQADQPPSLSTSTAPPDLDEYQPPITTELPSSPALPLPTILQRKNPGGRGKGIDCEEEYAACFKNCFASKKTKQDATRGLYHTGLNKCMKGCLSVGCGGNPPSRSKR